MAWIGQRDSFGGLFNPAGLTASYVDAGADVEMLTGSVMVQFTHAPSDVPVNLVRYMTRDPRPAALTLRVDPDGALRLMLRSGTVDEAARLDLPRLTEGETVVLRYGWNVAADCGVLSAEVVGRDLFVSAILDTVVPMTQWDARQIIVSPRCALGDRVVFLAVSDELVPGGPMPGLDGAARVMTPDGAMRLEDVAAGQIVLASDGQEAQVRWVGKQVLPAMGVYQPFQVRAPYYGSRQDMVMSASQRLHLDGTEVEYLFSAPEVAVTLGDLADKRSVLPRHGAPLATYYAVMIDRSVALNVDGMILPAFDPTAILEDPVLAVHSVLADLPLELVPRHPEEERVSLRAFEAQSLRRLRAT